MFNSVHYPQKNEIVTNYYHKKCFFYRSSLPQLLSSDVGGGWWPLAGRRRSAGIFRRGCGFDLSFRHHSLKDWWIVMISLWQMVLYSDPGTVHIKLKSLVTPCPPERRKKTTRRNSSFLILQVLGCNFCNCARTAFWKNPGEIPRRWGGWEASQLSRRGRHLSQSGRKSILAVGKPNTAEEFSIRTLL